MSEPQPQQQYVPQNAQQACPQRPYQPQQVGHQQAPQTPPQHNPRKPRRCISVWLPVFVLMIVLDMLGCLYIIGCLLNVGSMAETSSVDFAQVADKCDNRASMMSGDDDSLSADITYYDGINGTEANKAYECLVSEIDIPSSITHKIDNTRTLDGTQSDTWDKTKITWSYSSNMDSDLDGGTLSMTFERLK